MENIHRHDFNIKFKDEVWVLNVSDVHYDSKNCDRKLLKKHFDFIKSVNGKIIINGDWLDVMGMKHDPRSIPNDIRPEYMKPGASYLDLVIEDSFEFLKKYKDNLLLIGYGNHETNIVKRQQIDPLKWLVKLLHAKGSNVMLGCYTGALILGFNINGTDRRTSKIFYHHGYGGNAKRSKGVLNADLDIGQNPWADIITSGHDHQKWHLPYMVKDLDDKNNKWRKRKVDILKTGSYKKKSEGFGWEVEKNFNEPTLGGYFIKYKYKHEETTKLLTTEIIEAK